MMTFLKSILTCFLVCNCVLNVCADDAMFRQQNPDGMKYEFARSYISSLSHFNRIEERWQKSETLKTNSTQIKFVEWNVERLVNDNMDIRIAKNYLIKYFQSNNPLMRKVSDSFIYMCDQLIDLNRQERNLWEYLHSTAEGDDVDQNQEKKFIAQQEDLALRRKKTMRSLVQITVLMTKTILSENVKQKDVEKRLAISDDERDKLIKKIDGFSKENLDWGIKPGQTFLQAAIASIREVLEDPIYLSTDQ